MRTALRAPLTVAAALFVALVASVGAADEMTFPDPTGPAGGHDVASVRIDNSGPVVEVAVRHDGARWRGATVIALDVTGDRGPDVTVTVPHRGPDGEGSRYVAADGAPWRCDDRRNSWSPDDRPVTVLRVARSCLAGARVARATVRVAGDGLDPDVARTTRVAQQSRPNVLMVMVDDMRADDLVHMSQVRELIGEQGATFANAFSQYPLCCPARASVLSGQYAHNHKVYSHHPPYGFPVFDDSSTVATWLHDAGYRTTYLGKYLNGYGRRPEPGKTSGTSTHYVPPGWDEWHASVDGGFAPDDPDEGGTYRYYDTTLSDNGEGFIPLAPRYQTNAYADRAVADVTRLAASSTPFFSYVSFTAPHHGGPNEADDPGEVTRDDGAVELVTTPARPRRVVGSFDEVITQAPGADWVDPDLSDRPEQFQSLPPLNDAEKAALLSVARQRAEALMVVDQAVGRIIAALQVTGELEDTLVIFTSDNGYLLGEVGIRKGKVLPYEPSLRIPLVMRGPGIPAGVVRHDPIMTIDVAPTIAALTDVVPPGQVDGVSMLAVARQGDLGWSRGVLTETGPQATVRGTDEVGAPLPPGGDLERDLRYMIGVRTSRYLYTDLATGEEELYDLITDPRQYHNLVKDPAYSEVRDSLREVLAGLRGCDGEGCAKALPPGL